jgi:hypothetical protein
VTLIERHAALIDSLATGLGVESRALRALLRVEAAGEGLSAGRAVIRIEVHHLWRAVPPAVRPRVDARYQVRGPRPWEGHYYLRDAELWRRLHQPGAEGQLLEWEALTFARSIDERAAVESTSWGCGQILGRWWRECGYASPSMFAAAQSQEPAQLACVAAYLRHVSGLLPALARRDWRAVAAAYNGSGQVDWYAAELAEAYGRG